MYNSLMEAGERAMQSQRPEKSGDEILESRRDENLSRNVKGQSKRERGETEVCFRREKHVRYPTGREIEL